MKKSLFLSATILLSVFLSAQTNLISYGSSWKYLANGTNQGTAWRATSFNDAAWTTGTAQLGYGDGDEATVVSYGSNPNNKYITTYFRKTITVANASIFTSFTLNIKRDDGAVVYINGTERFRTNMPSGSISYTTKASADAADDGNTAQTITLAVGTLVTGTNVIAVEIHQRTANSSDISFDLQLIGAGDVAPPIVNTYTPADNSTNVSNAANLILTFNENIQKGTGNILIKEGGVTTQTINVTSASVTVSGNTVTIDPANFTYNAAVNVEMAAGVFKDLSNNNYAGITNATTWNFNVENPDLVAPTVTTYSPADNASNVTFNTNLVFTFSENIQKGTGNILIKEGGITTQTINVTSPSVTVSGNTVTIDPANFTYNAAVNVEIAAGAFKDLSNNNYAGILNATTWNFNVENPDLIAPTVITYSPADNATGVLANSNLVLTFSENVQKGTGNILIKEGGVTTQTIDVTSASVAVSGNTVTIDPANFTYNAAVNIEIAAGAFKDLSNNNYVGITNATTWNFNVENPDLIAPTITTYSPADNANGVLATANLVLTFSENVQKGTGNILIKEGGITTQTIDVTSASVTVSGNTVTIDAANFTYNAAVNIEIAAGAFKDLSNNNYAGIADAATWNFNIENPDLIAPTVMTYSPADNATGVLANSNLVLTFSENVQKGTGNILIKEGGITTQTIDVTSASVTVSGNTVTIDPANFTYNAAVNIEIAAGAFKDLSNNNYVGITDATTWNFNVENPDLIAPTVTTYSPADNATGVLATANLVLTFSENVQKGTGNILIKEGGITTQTIDVTSASVTVSGNTVTIDAANFTYNAAVNIEIAAGAFKDLSNNNYAGIADAATWNFNIENPDLIAPTVMTYSPADNATGVLANSNLVLTFSENVQKGTGNILIKEGGITTQTIDVASASVTVSGNTVTIDPANFTYNAAVNVEIAAGAFKDLSNNNYSGIADATIWNFNVENPDLVAPTVITYSPVDDATGILATANLVLTFSENVQKGTGNILIKEGGITIQTIDVSSASVTVSGNTVTIDPANFTYNAAVNVEIAAGAFKDLSNNNYSGIADAVTWNFNVENPDLIAPTVITYSPVDNASNVVLNANLVLTFSENMQKGTGNILIKEGGVTTQTINVSSASVIVSGNTVTIDPANFTYSAAVNIEMAAGVFKDRSNNNYAGITNATTWNFTIQAAPSGPQTLVAYGATWKYLDNGTNQGTAWKGTGFNDASWAAGPGQLGYGDGDEATIVSYGSDANNKYITTYFRKTISIADASIFTSIAGSVKRDDGIAIYINGTEVYRNTLAAGALYNTFATAAVSDDGATPQTFNFSPSVFVSGNNVIAVEIHQNAGTSTDISFDLQLIGNTNASITRGPYMNSALQTGVVIRWRTDVATNSKVNFGNSIGNLTQSVTDNTNTTEHIITLTGLNSNTLYYYNIGSTTQVLQGDANNYFKTMPLVGSTQKIRFLAMGDMGNNSTNQVDIRNAYLTFNGSNYTDGLIMMGDNAYNSGTDAEFQSNFFNIYQGNLTKNHVLWPSPGNHDYANSTARQADHVIPYYDMFTLPSAGQAGGVASNTEAFYSYNYGNVHFVSLDSYGWEAGSTRLYDTLGAQAVWLKQDLAANTQPWTVVYFHHPPYTKGSHNSDTETELINMRQNIVRILERYKVDMVLNGHSHDYERSYLINGHYGLENTFSLGTNALSSSSAKYDGTANSCIYIKNPSDPKNGIVYAVVGSAGQLGGTTTGYPHDAMYYSNATVGGALYFEVENNRLNAKWICSDGVVRDNFTIMKDVNKTTNLSIPSGTPTQISASWEGNYSWSTGATTKTITVSPTSNSIYTVTDGSGCITDVFNISITGGSARYTQVNTTPEASSNTALKVMPTLAKRGQQVVVQLAERQKTHASIVDVNGKVIQKLEFYQTLYIPTEKLKPGVYFIRFDGKFKQATQKFVVMD